MIQVSDVNDHEPQFEREEYSTDLVENNYVGAVIITVSSHSSTQFGHPSVDKHNEHQRKFGQPRSIEFSSCAVVF